MTCCTLDVCRVLGLFDPFTMERSCSSPIALSFVLLAHGRTARRAGGEVALQYTLMRRLAAAAALIGVLVLPQPGQPASRRPIHPAPSNRPPRARIGNQLLEKIEAAKPRQGIATAHARSMSFSKAASGEARIAVTLVPQAGLMGPQIDEARVESLGGQVDAVSRSFMRVHVPIGDIERLATHPDVALIRAPAVPVPDDLGSVVAEAVNLVGTPSLYAAGTTGAGVKVAVMDSGFIGYNEAIAAGELPQNTVAVDINGAGLTIETDHGTLVAEMLMDMAPDAELTLLRISDLVDVENAAAYARDNNISIVVMSVSWYGYSYYDDTGPVSAIFNEMRDVDGILPVVSIGNYAENHWGGTWVDANNDGYLEFIDDESYLGLSRISSEASRIYIRLDWNQYGHSTTDLDLYLVTMDQHDDEIFHVVASSAYEQNGPEVPGEVIQHVVEPGTKFYLRIRHAYGVMEPGLDMSLTTWGTFLDDPVLASSLFDPAAAHGTIAVGAVDQEDWTLTHPPLRWYSSQGPTHDGRLKPEIVAPDGLSSYTRGDRVAQGTSISAPIVAGAAALILSEDPSRTADDVANRLLSMAIDTGRAGPDNEFGYGRLHLEPGSPPVAVDDVAETGEDTPVVIDVLANDADPSSNSITIVDVEAPEHGRAIINGDDTITYIPEEDYNGPDTFVYEIQNTVFSSNSATVTVHVSPIQDPPQAVMDRGATLPSTPLIIDVLANDFDPDGEAITLTAVTDPSHGAAVDNGNGTITYIPAAQYEGPDAFEYTIEDPPGASDTGLVDLWVSATNVPPVAVADTATTLEETSVEISVMDNDYDYDGDALSLDRVVAAQHGTATIVGGNIVRFDPALDLFGEASFTYEIRDARGGTAQATVLVTVANVNDAPDAVDDAGRMNRNESLVIDVLANDADAEGDRLTVSSVGAPNHGTTVDNGDGTVTYTPYAGFVGTDHFSYVVEDVHGAESAGQVTVRVFLLPGIDWTAFNDMNTTGGTQMNAENVTTHAYNGQIGRLRNLASGGNVAVQIQGATVEDWDTSQSGAGYQQGTDAANVFNGMIDPRGANVLRDETWRATITFTNLDPNKDYTLTLSANRGDPLYAEQRFTRVTLAGADAYTNTSSAGVVVYGDDSVSLSTGYNTANGYVAQWTDIRALDGTFTVISQWDSARGEGSNNDRSSAMAYFRLEQWTNEMVPCQESEDCDDGNACTEDTCNPETGWCENPYNTAPCDDGTACTVNDVCEAGLCRGKVNDELCEDGDPCTLNFCLPYEGCQQAFENDNVPCDDGVDCTIDDLCYGGVCGGADACADGELCDLDRRQCIARREREVNFSAYNDLAWANGQRSTGITWFTSPESSSAYSSSGELIKYEDGTPTGVTLTIEGGVYSGLIHSRYGQNALAGTDAYDEFGGVIDTLGTIQDEDEPNSPLMLYLTGLNPDRRYRLVFHSDRAVWGWNRNSMVTLLGAEAFRNISSVADDNPYGFGGRLFLGPQSASTLLPSDNSNGYVVRFDEIDPGDDGEVSLHVIEFRNEDWRGKHGSAVLLQEYGAECAVDADCDDGNECWVNTCDTDTGNCVNVSQQAPCDDGIDCTVNDECFSGECVGIAADQFCEDENVCTDDICVAETGCVFVNNTADCDDGIACTENDQCTAGACQGASNHMLCDDQDLCTDDVCTAGVGCASTNNTALCDDGIDCTVNDRCAEGACESGIPQAVMCEDGNVCTDETCDPITGCESTNNTAACEDGIACTEGDQCSEGTCLGGLPNANRCDDANVCTDEVCAAGIGCRYTDNSDPCDSGLACTVADICVDGACAGGTDLCPAGRFCSPETGVCVPGYADFVLRAYNDLAWRSGQTTDNISLISADGSGLDTTGEMIDYESGEGTGITLTVANGRYDPDFNGGDGRAVAPGTDAGDLFAGIVDTRGAVAYINDPNRPLVLTFAGLDPDGAYMIAYHGDRGAYGWDRASRVTLSGAAAFVNVSSAANDNPDPSSEGALFSGPDAPSTRLPSDNPAGYVARFTDIRSGPDGEVELVVAADGTAGARGKYASAVMIGQIPTTCRRDADCNDNNICTDDVCDIETGNCVNVANQMACDDGIDCTEGDQCDQGRCTGGTIDHALCNDGNVCTHGICQIGTGCTYQNHQDPCDDGVACTANDACAEGVCAGDDACAEGSMCHVDTGLCVPAEPESGFRAYNDLAWREGQLSHQITRISSAGSSLATRGEMVNYETGDGTGVTLTVTGGRYAPGLNGRDGRAVAPGTDAGDLFAGIVDTLGAVAYINDPSSPLVLTFTGLNPTATYRVAIHGDRGAYGWDRASLATLTGADAFANHSSQAQDNPAPESGGALYSGPDDPSTRMPADNPNGYVVAFTDVDSGADGEFAVVVSADGNAGNRGKYVNAVMLAELNTGCGVDADCDDDNVCTDDVCNVNTSVCVTTPNQSPCDDGIHCTEGEQCADGVCQGGALNHASCDDGHVCTDDTCAPITGCQSTANTADCDDGVACTANDVCAEGICSGSDVCPHGQACNPATDQCAIDSQPLFEAYNDLAWGRGQLETRITHFTSPNGGSQMPSAGELVDHGTGEGTGVTLHVAGGNYNGEGHAYDGGDAPAGTDAMEIFGGIVSTRGAIAYINAPNNPLMLTFTNLEPTRLYTVVFHGDRGAYGWDRASTVRIHGAGAFTNTSSAAEDNPASGSGGAIFSGPDDPTTRLPSGNPNGYVARFSEIDPGADGEIMLTIEADGNSGYRGKYASAVMIEALNTGCQVDAECDDGNSCTDDACDPVAGCVSVEHTDPCDDGIACTENDVCAHGQCAGIVTCPADTLCDFESGQCVAGSVEEWVAFNDLYDDRSGDHSPNTTSHNYRASAQALVNYETGESLPVTMTGTTVGGYDPSLSGGDSAHGTDADTTFGGIVSLRGGFELDADPWQNTITFDNLATDKRYTIILTANRNYGGYGNARYGRVTIVGADAYTNASSDGVIVNGNDSVSFSVGDNRAGYVARWTDITAVDGRFSIVSEWDPTQGQGGANTKGYAMSVFKLIQMGR